MIDVLIWHEWRDWLAWLLGLDALNISPEEALWSAIALVTWSVALWLLVQDWLDRRALRQAGINGQARYAATESLVLDFLLWLVQCLGIAIGWVRLNTPPGVRETVQHEQRVGVYVLIGMQLLVMLVVLVKFFGRRKQFGVIRARRRAQKQGPRDAERDRAFGKAMDDFNEGVGHDIAQDKAAEEAS